MPKIEPTWTPTYERRSHFGSRVRRYIAAQTAPKANAAYVVSAIGTWK